MLGGLIRRITRRVKTHVRQRLGCNITSVQDKKATGDRHCEEQSDVGYQGQQEKSKVSCKAGRQVTKPIPFAPGLPRTQPLRGFWVLAMTPN
jgi:hypothetical protein